ncbi:MAG TPA: TIGR01777 family oxidoreductase [Microbacteriaceae bacterium]|nr:TIGR01777 family oxidoreductase [Microbacteriaceae bacterium]
MSVLIAGSTGLIGSVLVEHLSREGVAVRRLVRGPETRAGDIPWHPGDRLNPRVFDGVETVINLAGASIAQIPWTAKRRADILESRIDSTRTLVTALRKNPGARLINASAVGIYGDRGDTELSEESERGTGFLADVVEAWEHEALELGDSGRVVLVRTGLVVARGGAVAPLRLLTNLGLGGPLGSGRQWWPWISLRDEVRAIDFLRTADVAGAVNLVGPTPATMSDLGRHLARSLRRPFWFPAPAFALRAALGQAGQELLLNSQKIVPSRLNALGFSFADETVEAAVAQLMPR